MKLFCVWIIACCHSLKSLNVLFLLPCGIASLNLLLSFGCFLCCHFWTVIALTFGGMTVEAACETVPTFEAVAVTAITSLVFLGYCEVTEGMKSESTSVHIFNHLV